MSVILLEFVKSFAAGRLSAGVFSEAYMELWKIERDNNLLQNDPEVLSECLFSVFCAADMFNPEDLREEYEFDDEKLRCAVINILKDN